MRVGELIELLQQCDPNYEVWIMDHYLQDDSPMNDEPLIIEEDEEKVVIYG